VPIVNGNATPTLTEPPRETVDPLTVMLELFNAALGTPVMFVPTSADGVPSAGFTSAGLLANTRVPEPVDVVEPDPPFAMFKTPPRTTFPPVADDGVRPVLPALIDATAPATLAAA
jgi:hypothetical protein